MKGLSDIGRSFYGLSMAGMGMLTIVYRDFPYMFIPPKHSWIPTFITVFLGLLLFLGGLAIVFKLKSKTTAFVLGVTLLAIFFFYHVPYEFIATAAIVVKFKVRLASTLLGSMILIWFIILHIPRVINAPTPDLEGEIPSALLALAYSGIAFAIAGEPPF